MALESGNKLKITREYRSKGVYEQDRLFYK